MTVSSGFMWIGVISINIYHTYLLIVISPAVDFLLYSTLFLINSFVFFNCNSRRNYSKHWHNFWDFRFGNCFTFNGGLDDFGKPQKILHSHSTGPAGGEIIRVCCSFLLNFAFSEHNTAQHSSEKSGYFHL